MIEGLFFGLDRLGDYMLFKINHSDVLLIAKTLGGSELALRFVDGKECVEHSKYLAGRYSVYLCPEEAKLMTELLSGLLVNSGVDDTGALNAIGQQIEILIDTFGCIN